MFAHTCTTCHQRRLVFSDQVVSLVNTRSGIVVRYGCLCGSSQTWVTGKATTGTDRVPVAA